jgi:uncharacterized protein involved in type VI secretion and phage assembly
MIPINLLTSAHEEGRFYGMTVGVVTNNKDEEGLGRVKVKFPWLSEQDESYWARVVTPMAGKDRGMYFLPEKDDEVLVAFEHGMIEFPYIIGALWNGQDKPPESNNDGKNNKRVIKSRSGHQIILDDTENNEQIIIRDKTGKNEIIIDSKNHAITVRVEKDMVVEVMGKVNINNPDGELVIETKKMILKGELEVEKNSRLKGNLKVDKNTKIKGNFDVQ